MLSLEGYASYTVHQGPSLEDVHVFVPLTGTVVQGANPTTEPTATAHDKYPPALPGRQQTPATTVPKPPPPSSVDSTMNR